ncbi:probable RNA methyltransferase CG11342 [Schistocerca americana]|uniref:probable RNA methyltransferase CG11342 n=1 Tax=Schistocerca americana TaxID=7009 RepID=UPI001F4F1729|nr:probable RNA methyltransferase CG11342 [Schistocerca americana]
MRLKENDPGAAQYGNFINYYQFHPTEARIKSLPTDVWNVKAGEDMLCLDVGSNSGELTQALYEFILSNLHTVDDENKVDSLQNSQCKGSNCYFLGLELDPLLTERAKNSNRYVSSIHYHCLNFMTDDKLTVLKTYLKQHGKQNFDVIFCFSVTMWIHLNYGDEGLIKFLKDLCAWTKVLVIEPQPWKCYRAAARRLWRAKGETFPELDALTIRHNVETEIEDILEKKCNFSKVLETTSEDWKRKIIFFRRHDS